MTADRLQKILARAGLGSRRSCETLIRDGRVTVNGRLAQIGSQADPSVDEIRLDGERLPDFAPPTYILVYKPAGVETSLRQRGPRPTVRQLVDRRERLVPVGRLDVDSEGLVLLTNDGETALRLTHPRYEHEKEYRVWVDRRPDGEQLQAWRRGVVLPDGRRTRPAVVRFEASAGRGAWLRVVLREGRKRQIRESARVLGLRVLRLIRTRVGPLSLGDLRPGQWRELSTEEVRRLKRAVGSTRSQARCRPAEGRAKEADGSVRRRQNGHR
ncbi:MAG: pseudouridine synthase [Chloroflexota bacterium]